ncbi:MAG: class I poly(R)-hydroxyalkanoic acid synthase [Paracoccaceae bacterium]
MTEPTQLPPEAKASAEFAANMAEVAQLSQAIWAKMAEAQGEGTQDADPLNAMPLMAELTQALWRDPAKLAEATVNYWTDQQAIWQAAMTKFMGGVAGPVPDLPDGGKRFAHKDWRENALFESIKNSYLLMSSFLQNQVADAHLPARDQRKAAFLTRNAIEAMNPANFFALNPEVLETTNAEHGANLVRGLKMLLEDITRGKGKLLIRQTDMDAFEVGRNMAVTPGKVIWENNIAQLIQYAPASEKVVAKPFLFVPPWINKYYISDLNPKKSLMKWLVEQGHSVFVISWVNPDRAHAGETWDSYMQTVMEIIDVVRTECGQDQVNLGAYCIGGTLAGTLLAYMGKKGDTRVASATFFTAQLDFEDAGDLQVFVDEKTLSVVNEQMDEGYLPADTMASAFNALRSNDLVWGYIVNNYMLGHAPFPFDLLYWNSDSTAMPAKVHHFYLEQFYIHNALAKGNLKVLDTPVTLGDINVPVYHVATREDHIAPANSVYIGAKMMTGAKVKFVLAGSGHIAGVINPPAAGKYQHWTAANLKADTVEDWRQKAKEVAGSWWPDWDKWLKKQGGGQVAAREAGAVNGVIEDAPGRYVKVRFDKR